MFAACQAFGYRTLWRGCQGLSGLQPILPCCSSMWAPMIMAEENLECSKHDYITLVGKAKGMGASLILPVRAKSLMKNGLLLWANKQLYSQCLQQGFGLYNLGILSEDEGKNVIHLPKWRKYQVAKYLHQQDSQTRGKSFKLGIKGQVGEMIMTHNPLKKLWTVLVKRCSVMLTEETLKTVKQGGREVQKS